MVGKIKKYEEILVNYLIEYSKEASDSDNEYQFIFDKANHIYQVVRIGWEKKYYFRHAIIFHFQIKPVNGKVWVYANNTDREIGKEFADLGIPASDIVIGFIPEVLRSQSGYAIA